MSTNIVPRAAANQSGEIINAPQSTGLSTISNGAVIVPDWIDGGKEDAGLDLMGQYVSPPRLKIIQGQSGQELKQQFGESAVIVSPDNLEVTPPIDFKHGEKESWPIRVIPIFFWPEYCIMNPMAGDLPFIRERSIDPRSKIAQQCTQRDFKARDFECPEVPGKFCKSREVFNFIVQILDRPEVSEPVVISFHSGSYTEGQNWCKLCRMPRGASDSGERKTIPCYAQIFSLTVSPRSKNKNDWYAWNVRAAIDANNMREFIFTAFNDPEQPGLAQQWYEHLRERHLTLAENYRDDLLRPDYKEAFQEEERDIAPASSVAF